MPTLITCCYILYLNKKRQNMAFASASICNTT
jgi:hypothetical protein